MQQAAAAYASLSDSYLAPPPKPSPFSDRTKSQPPVGNSSVKLSAADRQTASEGLTAEASLEDWARQSSLPAAEQHAAAANGSATDLVPSQNSAEREIRQFSPSRLSQQTRSSQPTSHAPAQQSALHSQDAQRTLSATASASPAHETSQPSGAVFSPARRKPGAASPSSAAAGSDVPHHMQSNSDGQSAANGHTSSQNGAAELAADGSQLGQSADDSHMSNGGLATAGKADVLHQAPAWLSSLTGEGMLLWKQPLLTAPHAIFADCSHTVLLSKELVIQQLCEAIWGWKAMQNARQKLPCSAPRLPLWHAPTCS